MRPSKPVAGDNRDTSVLVAGFASWHVQHAVARRALAGPIALLAHTALEALSVLTRLPPPHRVAPAAVWPYLDQFDREWITVPGRDHKAIVRRLVDHGIAGGAVYDAYVGLVAQAADAELLTLDRRAVSTYERLDVPHRLLA